MIDIVVIPMGKEGYKLNDICKRIAPSDLFPEEPLGQYVMAVKDNTSPNDQWQAQQLFIIDTEASKVVGDKAIGRNEYIRAANANHGLIDVTESNCASIQEHWVKVIAAYPAIPNVPPILLTDVSTMVEAQMKCKVEVEPELYVTKRDIGYTGSYIGYKYHPTGEICLKVVKEEYRSEKTINEVFAEAGIDIGNHPTPNTVEDKAREYAETKFLVPLSLMTNEGDITDYKLIRDSYYNGYKAGYLSHANEQGKEAKWTDEDMMNAFSRKIGIQTLHEDCAKTWMTEYTSQINHV